MLLRVNLSIYACVTDVSYFRYCPKSKGLYVRLGDRI